jgi:hypothetical protein
MTGIRRLLQIVIAALLLTCQPHAAAQSVSAPELRAAFLFNFVKFTGWPSESLPQAAPVVVCIVGDEHVADAFEALTKDQTVDGRRLTTRRMKRDDAVAGCHLLYAAELDARRARDVVSGSAGQAVLTVSDFTEFVEVGGVASFFVENGKMRFAVNPDAVERARLRISSKLLGLARIVRDDTNGNR